MVNSRSEYEVEVRPKYWLISKQSKEKLNCNCFSSKENLLII
jgi:hypothetical protein